MTKLSRSSPPIIGKSHTPSASCASHFVEVSELTITPRHVRSSEIQVSVNQSLDSLAPGYVCSLVDESHQLDFNSLTGVETTFASCQAQKKLAICRGEKLIPYRNLQCPRHKFVPVNSLRNIQDVDFGVERPCRLMANF